MVQLYIHTKIGGAHVQSKVTDPEPQEIATTPVDTHHFLPLKQLEFHSFPIVPLSNGKLIGMFLSFPNMTYILKGKCFPASSALDDQSVKQPITDQSLQRLCAIT